MGNTRSSGFARIDWLAKGPLAQHVDAGELGVYDHQAERVWRHLDSCQFLTYLHARPPRVSCPEHGVLQVTLPWAHASSRFTNLFEALAKVKISLKDRRVPQILTPTIQ